jgi:hypothetical protein
MALAFAVAFVPAGGNVAEAVLTAITIGFLTAIAWSVYVVSRQNQLTLASLSDGRRAILYSALGLIALLIVGTDEMFASGGGTLVWLVLLGVAVAAIWRIWIEANTY